MSGLEAPRIFRSVLSPLQEMNIQSAGLLVVVSGALLAAAPSPLGGQTRPVPLDTLRVSASSRAAADVASVTRAVEVVGREAILRSPARTVAELLQWGLGVDVMPRSPALVDVALRGSSFEQVLILVDGVRVSDAQTGHFDLNLAIPLEQIERIEIVRGPASAIHGADAMGGVIQIVTRRGGRSAARLEVGSFETAILGVSHGVRAGEATADLALELQRSAGHRSGTDYEIGIGRVALAAPFEGRTVSADLGYSGRNFGADGFYGPFPSFERTRTGTASLALQAIPGAAFALEPGIGIRWNSDDFILRREDPAFYRNRHSTLQAGGEVMLRFAPRPRIWLAGGGEAYSDRLRSARLGDRVESRGAVLAEVVAGGVGAVTATGGVRADFHEAFGMFVSPSLAATWQVGPSVRLRSAFGRAFRTPTWTERYYEDPANIGDPDLAPERAWSGELGFDARVAPALRVAATTFRREARDLIDWAKPEGAPASQPWRTRNVEDASFRGLEAEVGYDGRWDLHWFAHGSWLSLRSDEAVGFTSKYALRPLAEAISVATDRAVGSGFTAGVRAQRARRLGEAGYHRLDGRLAYRARIGRVYLDLQNATGEVYPDITGARAAGRALLIGVEWGRNDSGNGRATGAELPGR